MKHPSWKDFPRLRLEIDLEKNRGHTYYGKAIDVLDLSVNTNKILDWRCQECDNQWSTTGNSRVSMKSNCPACAGQTVHSDGRNSMAVTHPDLAEEHMGDSTSVIAGTMKRLSWRCKALSRWGAVGASRARGVGCPACSGKAVHSDGRNSMAVAPDLAEEHMGDSTSVIAGTMKRLSWRCKACSHEWGAVGASRARGVGCPACSGKAVHSDGGNSMAVTHPDLAEEHMGDSTSVIAGTHKKLQFKCSSCDYIWKSTGKGQGCWEWMSLAQIM